MPPLKCMELKLYNKIYALSICMYVELKFKKLLKHFNLFDAQKIFQYFYQARIQI